MRSKTAIMTGLLMSVSATVVMALSPIDDLNKAVKELLTSLNNPVTSTSLVFSDLVVDDKRALKAAMTFQYDKKGALTNFGLHVPKLSYDYNGSNGPLAEFDASVEADLVALTSQEQVNELGLVITEMVRELGQDFLSEYGEAATVTVREEVSESDDNGNLVKKIVSGKMTVDFSKLPADMPSREVPVKNMELRLTAGTRGFAVSGSVTMNRDYKAFEEDQGGLKDWIELVLRQDPEELENLQMVLMMLDMTVSEVINQGFGLD